MSLTPLFSLRFVSLVLSVLILGLGLAGCNQHGDGGETLPECDVCPLMTPIPAGEFVMGRDGGEPKRYDGPVRKITIEKPFYMAKYEVTFAEFERFVEDSGYQPGKGCNMFLETYWGLVEDADWRNPGLPEAPRPNEPVVCVSWNDATAYADWVSEKSGASYRLPTEAEFEYVARDGYTGEFPWAGGVDKGCAITSMFDRAGKEGLPQAPWPNSDCNDGYAAASPIGSFPANGFGVHDIMGNVWEWTQDCYVLPYPEDGPRDGTAVEVEGDCERRTVRGASWETRPSRFAVSFRGRDIATDSFRTFGFRLVRDRD